MSQLVLWERSDAVACVTLNRPERHNSLVPPLLDALLSTLEAVQTQPGLRALVLQANGHSFSTGGDVRGFFEHGDTLEAYAGTIVGLLNQVILALFEFPIPTLAAVHGMVTGGSLGLVLACDIVLVAPEASFTPYYSVVGFSPDGGWTALLPAIIGAKRTTEVLMRNQTISADQAVRWGLANRVVPADGIRDEALRIAKDVADKKPGSLRSTKRLLRMACSDLEARLEAERGYFVQQITTEEARRGMLDFLKKRPAGGGG